MSITVTYFSTPRAESSLDRISDAEFNMSHADDAETGLAQVAARYPEVAAVLRRLALTDPGFREVCEEYALAQASLAGFEARLDAAERPEIADYQTIIAELESEIDRFLKETGWEV